VATGLLAESGRQTGRRGRAGTFYRLRGDAGVALALSAGPDGLIVETCDLRGTVSARLEREVPHPARSAELGPILVDTVSAALAAAPGPVLGWALSVAGPVDQATGRLVQLPNSPFLLDELNPRQLVDGLTDTELLVDNDVNWAALAEQHEGSAQDLDHFVYCYLGPGLGAALVSDGAVLHGHRGLAGELAHVLTAGPGGRSMRLLECFTAWELQQPGSDAIDVARVAEVLHGGTAEHRRVRDELVGAVAGALCSITALVNPEGVLLGGPWSSAGDLIPRVAELVHTEAAVGAVVRPAQLDGRAPLTGARLQAVRTARRSLLGRG
jgi:predicted NBD/HSP70 family sugar kinase